MSTFPASKGPEISLQEVQEVLEEYLAREGLLQALPEGRRRPHLPPTYWPWAAALAIAGFTLGYLAKASPLAISASALVPLGIFLIVRELVKLIVALALPIRRRMLGRIILVSTSVIPSVIIGAILGEARWTVLYLLLMFLSHIVLRAVTKVGVLVALSDMWRAMRHALRRTIRAMGLLLPLMVVLLLLSVFSSELWQSVGSLATWQLVLALLMVLSLGVLVGLARYQGIVDRIPPPKKLEPAELIAVALLEPPLNTHPERDALRAILESELVWRHVEEMQARAVRAAHRPLFWRILGRLTTSAVLLAVLMGVYLGVLFNLLFSSDVITAFYSGLARTVSSPLIAVAKVTIFLVTFIVTYFVVQALTEERMQKELFEDLSNDMQRWVQNLVLYYVCLQRGYQLWGMPTTHFGIRTTEIEIVVPAGTTEIQVSEICARVARTHWFPSFVVIITAYERQSKPQYDWDIPGRKWQLICTPQGDDLISEWTPTDDFRYQHPFGLECECAGEPIPDEWFGFRAHDKLIARKLWESQSLLSRYHVYNCSGPKNTWIFLRLRRSLENMDACQELTEKVCKTVIESKLAHPFLICVSLYNADSPYRFAHLLWRRQPAGLVFVPDKSDTL